MGLKNKLANVGLGLLIGAAAYLGLETIVRETSKSYRRKADYHHSEAAHFISADYQKWKQETQIAEEYDKKADKHLELLLKYGIIVRLQKAVRKEDPYNFHR
jgi:hypothetical protein